MTEKFCNLYVSIFFSSPGDGDIKTENNDGNLTSCNNFNSGMSTSQPQPRPQLNNQERQRLDELYVASRALVEALELETDVSFLLCHSVEISEFFYILDFYVKSFLMKQNCKKIALKQSFGGYGLLQYF